MEKKRFEQEARMIKTIKEIYPNQFLTIILIRDSNGEVIPIGLFQCMKCGKPIDHYQFNFGRCCGACDVGKDMPKWKIEKPNLEVQNI